MHVTTHNHSHPPPTLSTPPTNKQQQWQHHRTQHHHATSTHEQTKIIIQPTTPTVCFNSTNFRLHWKYNTCVLLLCVWPINHNTEQPQPHNIWYLREYLELEGHLWTVLELEARRIHSANRLVRQESLGGNLTSGSGGVDFSLEN